MSSSSFEDPYISGSHDERRFHDIVEVTLACFQGDRIADAQIPQRPEKGVAMACEDDVAGVARQGGIGDMADRTLQDGRRIPLDHDKCDPDARNLDDANGIPISRLGENGSG